MPKNIVILCDGTGNKIDANQTNVAKLYRTLKKDPKQVVYYQPGIATVGYQSLWTREWNLLGFGSSLWTFIDFATGRSLRKKVEAAYSYLASVYEPGDKIFMFGFSRGSHTVRVLAALIKAMGLVTKNETNLTPYVFNVYLATAHQRHEDPEEADDRIAKFKNTVRTADVKIHFLGVYDTVATIMIPARTWLGIFPITYIRRMRDLPYAIKNDAISTIRHAVSMDEKRFLFTYDRVEPAEGQDCKEVWFAGDHSDCGGGYWEQQAHLSKYPLKWMADEAILAGLQTDSGLVKMILGEQPPPANYTGETFVKPSVTIGIDNGTNPHGDDMGIEFHLMEWIPVLVKPYHTRHTGLFGFHFKFYEPRYLSNSGPFVVHDSVISKLKEDPSYNPPLIAQRDPTDVAQNNKLLPYTDFTTAQFRSDLKTRLDDNVNPPSRSIPILLFASVSVLLLAAIAAIVIDIVN